MQRQKHHRVVELVRIDDVMQRFEQRIAEGLLYSDCQIATDPASEDFLSRVMCLFSIGVLAYSRIINLLARLFCGHR